MYRLGREFGILKFWEIAEELTPTELAIHRLMMEIDPPTPERDDMRAAWMTTNLIASQLPRDDVNEVRISELLDNLGNYMRFIEPSQKDKASRAIQQMRENS